MEAVLYRTCWNDAGFRVFEREVSYLNRDHGHIARATRSIRRIDVLFDQWELLPDQPINLERNSIAWKRTVVA